MKPITISEASRLAGVSRQTIYNSIDKGELSRNSSKTIDLSELIRVYPNISINSNDVKEVTPKDISVQNDVFTIEIKYLKQQVENLEEQLKEKKESESKLMRMIENLQQKALPDLSNKTGKKGLFDILFKNK